MSDTLVNNLSQYGIDYLDAMDRMDNNASLYKKLALKYLNNDCMANLDAAMAVKDYDAAYKAAHTLKGASGNLSFSELFEASAALSNALYEGEYQAAEELLPTVQAAHKKTVEGLLKWEAGEF